MIMTFDKPLIADVLQREGIAVTRRGARAVCLCPFHAEQTPSFTIYPDGRAHCYGCGWDGDSISLVMALRGLDFKSACAHLGIPLDNSPEARKAHARARQRRELVDRFRQWCAVRRGELLRLVRSLDRRKIAARTDADVDALADLYHAESRWELELDAIEHGTDEARFAIYTKGVHHV